MISIKNIIILISITVVSLFITSCSDEHSKSASDKGPIVQVRLATAGSGSQENHFSVSGKVEAEQFSDISPQIMGVITKVPAKIGDTVTAGQTLATISNSDIQAKYAQAEAGVAAAEAALKNTEKDYKRIQALYLKQSATQKELDDITTQRDRMQAQLDQALAIKNETGTMLSYSIIKAPFDGVITGKHVDIGDLASPGKPLFSIQSGQNFKVAALVSEASIGSIKKGTQVKVLIKSTGQEIDGVISEYSQSSLNTGGQYLIKIYLDSEQAKSLEIFSGMYVNVLIPGNEKVSDANNVMVDKKAIITQGQLTGIYTISDQNTAILRWVRLGRSYGGQVEVLSGLAAGEKYIVESDSRLLNGTKVQAQ